MVLPRPLHSALIGFGSWAIEVAMPDEWLNDPPWLRTVVLLVGAAFVFLGAGGWLVERFPKLSGFSPLRMIGAAQSRRMPLVAVRDLAAKRGWIFDGQSLHCLDFADALIEAGRLGELRFFGRPGKPGYENQAHFNPLTPIAPDQWGPPLRFVGPNLVDARGDNSKTQAWNFQELERGGHYFDLHVDRSGVPRWLRVEAVKFKGRASARG